MDFLAAVVRKGKAGIGKMKTVAVFVIAYALKYGNVSVGNVVRTLEPLAELVSVFNYHEFVAADKLLFAELDLGADAGVVAVGPLV